MTDTLAFALGGGGARGALQVGAVRALLEAGFQPAILTGTSIGAMNAVALALWGASLQSVDQLQASWLQVSELQILDPRFQTLIVRALMRRPDTTPQRRTIEFLEQLGITADLCFGQVLPIRLGLVSTDIVSGSPVIYGLDPTQKIREGLLASIAIQPWFMPQKVSGHNLIDGGLVSNVPIEPAMRMGASEIIAIDLTESEPNPGSTLSQIADRVSFTVVNRIIALEMALAEARGIPVRRLNLRAPGLLPWDFSRSTELFDLGYQQAVAQMAAWG